MKNSFIKPTKIILINGYVNSINNHVLVLILINSKRITKQTSIKIYKHLYSRFRIMFGDIIKDNVKTYKVYKYLTKTRKPYSIIINNQYYRAYFIKEGRVDLKIKSTNQIKQFKVSNKINKIGKAKKIIPLKTIMEVFKQL